ncbi:MAG: aspartate kinase [Bdellovibrionaceae bacterium]|nr:aspartate kinase [Pseudobdellovibrionaceae bacterium]
MSRTENSTNPISQPLVVQKYGGATLADPKLVKAAARRILEQSRRSPLIVVVSAMGTTTNSLIDLARQVSLQPARRELDMLLSVGERISMSLVSMALQDLGGQAISFTGSQAGILTDDDHFNAKIIDVKAFRVEEALKTGRIVILAGFQGVSPQSKEITTLGRGGSDVTAVAMAAAFKAARCEILKEVPAVFSADPRVVAKARPLSRLNYDELLEMTFWGAKVLHHRSVELARRREVPLYIGPAADDLAAGTQVGKGMSMFESQRPLSLNSHERVLEMELAPGDPQKAMAEWQSTLAAKEIPSPQLLAWVGGHGLNRVLVTGAKEILDSLQAAFGNASVPRVLETSLCSVTLTCAGGVNPDLAGKMLGLLKTNGIDPRELRVGPLSVTVFLAEEQRRRAMECLHSLIPA